MNRAVPILCVVVAAELVGAAALLGWWAVAPPSPSAAPEPPRPEMSFLDSVTAAEIRQRQAEVAADRAEDWRALAEIYVLYGFFAEADVCCRRAAALDPSSFWTYFWWGTALSRLGETEASSEKFRAAVDVAEGPLADVTWYCIGLNLLREENPSEAETAFRTAPGYPPADYELAKLLVRSDRAAEAVPLLDHLIENHPQRQKYYQLRSRAARQPGDRDAAAQVLDRAYLAPEVLSSDELTGFLEEQIGRHGLDVWIEEGRRFLAEGAVAEAAARLREALGVEWRQEAADLLAHAELQLGHPDEAVRVLNEAIARSSPLPERLVALGNAYQMQHDYDRARQAWERSVRLRPNKAAHERLAEHFAQRGDEQAATRHRALALLAAGIAALRNHELETAENDLQQSVELAPQQAHAWYHLGECRRLLGETEAAQTAFRQCLTINPDHGRAQRSLDRLLASPRPG